MAKRKYIILIALLPQISFASPWLPEPGEYISVSSAYITNQSFKKRCASESKDYYTIEQEIRSLEATKHVYDYNKLTPQAISNRVKAIDGNISNLKRLQSTLPSYYPLRTLSQSLEYGLSDKYSFNVKIFSQLKENFTGSKHNNAGFEIGPKIKMKQGEKYIVSVQPSLGNYRDSNGRNHMTGEGRLLLGRATKHKLGKAFNTMEIAPSFVGKAFECHMDYTAGIETNKNFILTLQTYNNFRPKASKLYKQTSFEQFSVAKQLMVRYDSRSKITLQVGYFYEFSISARKAITSGVQFSIWVQI